ncbi:plasmid replication initiator RepA [Pantoea agglomerans]|uniref:plasmid replication initiator RepA n=1 Tax=Enterobacter agglomerans TaxID=549 RepID=UPI003C7D4307
MNCISGSVRCSFVNQDTAEALRAIAAGNGRAVMVGDVAQLESPESGAPFRLLQERSPIDVAVMKEIKRQLSDDLRGAVYSVIENKAAAALEKIDRVSPAVVSRRAESQAPQRSVIEVPPPPKDENGNELPGPDGRRAPRIHDAIVADYMSRTPSARAQTLIVTSLNDDRRALNAGIHLAMTEANELGGKAVLVPVLERVTSGRHDFNRFDAWKVGHVVLSGDRYLKVTGLDRGTKNVLLRDEDGRMRYYSPAELNATEIEVFWQQTLELRTGDSIRMTKTQRQAGHAAHEQYQVAALHNNGDVVLKGTSGEKVISPGNTLADQHIDYAWAVNMDKLLLQRNQRIEAQDEGILEPGTRDSVRAARRRWYEKARIATLLSRREKAVREKRRNKLGKLPLDERRSTMASWLIRTRPNHELINLDADSFDRLVWQHLNQLELGLGYEPAPPDVVH